MLRVRSKKTGRASSALRLWLRGLCTSILLCAFTASLLHYVVVAHEQCEEHGQLSHASHDGEADHDHAPPHDEADGDELAPRLLGGDHDDHCQSSGVLPSLAAEVAPAALSKRLALPEVLERDATVHIDTRSDLLSRAPKQSPPV